ncbi:MAG: GAF domain-containing protein [Gammaproteobacteria bacterium]|nr:GAF domain-containing protein [Gammaproteobacteria bacterium]
MTDKKKLYARMHAQAEGLFEGESDPIANAANLAALLFMELPAINWAGFYFLQDTELVLGPFQGQPACVRIALGKGVCGTAAKNRQPLIVDNVDEFAGHIPCDGASQSEIVIPLLKDGVLLGVLDLDSPQLARFDQFDQDGLKSLANLYLKRTRL